MTETARELAEGLTQAPEIQIVIKMRDVLFLQTRQEVLAIGRGGGFDALLEAVEAVVDVGFVFFQQGGDGRGGEAGGGEEIQKEILVLPLGEGRGFPPVSLHRLRLLRHDSLHPAGERQTLRLQPPLPHHCILLRSSS